MTDPKQFLAQLFDFTFESFITTKLIKVLYALSMLGVTLWSLSILGAGLFSGKPLGMLGGLIGAPILFVVGIIAARVYMELLIVLFRIAEDIRRLANASAPPAGSQPGK